MSIWSLRVDRGLCEQMGLGWSYSMLNCREHPHLQASCASLNLFRHRLKRDRSPMRVRGEGWLRPGRRLRCHHPESPSPVPRTRRPPPLRPIYPPGVSRPGGRPDSGRNSAPLGRRQAGVVPSRSLEAGVSPCVYLAAFRLGPLAHILRMGICTQTGGCLWPGLLRAEQTLAENTLKRPSSQAKGSHMVPLNAKMLSDALWLLMGHATAGPHA